MKKLNYRNTRAPHWNALLGICLLCVFLTSARADQIVLKNGDRVTGTIVKKDGKTITVKTDHFGVVTTDWDQVESIKASEPVTVVLQDGRSVQGTVNTVNETVEVATPSGTVTTAPTGVTAIRDAEEQTAYERLQHPGWLDLWAGTATLGLAGTSGNSETLTFTTGVNAARVTNTDKTTLYFNAIKASALVNGVSAQTARAVRGGIGYDHNINPKVFFNAFNDYEYDRFQNLDLRFVIGGGAGYHAIHTDLSTLDLLTGFDYNHSHFDTPLTNSFGEFYWGDQYSRKMGAATSLVQSFRMFHDISAFGAYRSNFDVSAVTRITKWITWNVSLSDRYLRHPAPDRKTNDFLYSTGLGITFAR